jgi:hypothetical protein
MADSLSTAILATTTDRGGTVVLTASNPSKARRVLDG